MNLHKNSCEVSLTTSRENSERTMVVIWVRRTPKFIFFTFCMPRRSGLGKLVWGPRFPAE